ncbi:hypothetical protein [Streptomyces cucumeris]|uniref:hypothetical protein n=1 Tax=Streptomyces cucumeris TaxID=2962890 RepID=UPI0020C86993|nr:hypothetical protein [Streptomyces sp. NEAU-Y11]MCP9209712.1 hypothetical protein [Streptomyces sp. NEAU-Y11]
MGNLSTISSDDVISSYQQQLMEAHHKIAILEAKLTKAVKVISEQAELIPQQEGEQ